MGIYDNGLGSKLKRGIGGAARATAGFIGETWSQQQYAAQDRARSENRMRMRMRAAQAQAYEQARIEAARRKAREYAYAQMGVPMRATQPQRRKRKMRYPPRELYPRWY